MAAVDELNLVLARQLAEKDQEASELWRENVEMRRFLLLHGCNPDAIIGKCKVIELRPTVNGK